MISRGVRGVPDGMWMGGWGGFSPIPIPIRHVRDGTLVSPFRGAVHPVPRGTEWRIPQYVPSVPQGTE